MALEIIYRKNHSTDGLTIWGGIRRSRHTDYVFASVCIISVCIYLSVCMYLYVSCIYLHLAVYPERHFEGSKVCGRDSSVRMS